MRNPTQIESNESSRHIFTETEKTTKSGLTRRINQFLSPSRNYYVLKDEESSRPLSSIVPEADAVTTHLIVYGRKFTNSSFKFTSRLLSYAAGDTSADGAISYSKAEQFLNESRVKNNTQTKTQLSPEQVEVFSAEYSRYCLMGIELLKKHGFLPLSLADTINQKIFDPTKVVAVDGPFSGFAYSKLDFPSELIGFMISPQHIAGTKSVIEKVLSRVLDQNNYQKIDTQQLAGMIACMHEYGHLIHSAQRIIIATRIANEMNIKSPIAETLKDNRDLFWEIWEQADLEILHNLQNIVSSEDLERRKKVVEVTTGIEGDIEYTFIESIARGAELAVMISYLKECNLEEHEIHNIVDQYYQHFFASHEDFIFFANLCRRLGLNESNYDKHLSRILRGIKKSDLDFQAYLPFYGPKPKQAGYFLPIQPNEFRRFTNITSILPNRR